MEPSRPIIDRAEETDHRQRQPGVASRDDIDGGAA
jgi:hypothetical protein